MGKRLHEKGFPEKAKAKYIESLQRDLEYTDPLRALESLFFANGRTPENEKRLVNLLTASGLKGAVGRISDEEDAPEIEGPAAAQGSVPGEAAQMDQRAAPASTPAGKKLTPMERMKLLMEKNKD